MSVLHAVVFGVQLTTLVGFALAMRYFRSGKPSLRQLLLTSTAGLCSLTQLIVMARTEPAVDGATLGLGLCALANLLFWWSLRTHGRQRPAFAFRAVPPSSFRSDGPYALVRHPIYSAYLLAWLAGPVATGELWLLLPFAAMAVLYFCAARQEEAFFARSTFAWEYQLYQRRTGMFVPRVQARRAA